MILTVNSDASYMSTGKGRSCVGSYFFIGSIPQNGEPIQLYDNIASTCEILKFDVASATNAEPGALFVNIQKNTKGLPISCQFWSPTTANSVLIRKKRTKRRTFKGGTLAA